VTAEGRERNRTTVRAFVAAVNAQAWERIDAVVAPDVVRHSRAAGSAQVRSREELKAFLRDELTTFPDAHEEIRDLIAEGDKVAVRHGFSGTQRGPLGSYPPSDKRLESEYLAIYRLAGGKIVEIWAEWDNLSSLIQLGHIEPPG
jgi:steroid delta-isomerase-like uncharacterized protein